MNETIQAPKGISLDGPFHTGSLRIVRTRCGQLERCGLTATVLCLKISEAFIAVQSNETIRWAGQS
jgi:hypothetical protein